MAKAPKDVILLHSYHIDPWQRNRPLCWGDRNQTQSNGLRGKRLHFHAMKWLISTVLVLVLFSGLMPWLRKFGLGRLPGDITMNVRGKQVSIPIGSTLVMSALFALIAKIL